jgi:phage terminase large subunit-like protein
VLYIDHVALSIKERLARLDTKVRWELLSAMPEPILVEMQRDEWWYTARPEQIPPTTPDIFIILFLAGRGAGKSRAGSEWMAERIRKHPIDAHGVPTEWLTVADTLADARTINAEGPSGILNVLTRQQMDFRYKQSPRPMVLFPSGAKLYFEGADDEDTGRGYNAAGILCDEIAKWVKPYQTWYEGLLPSLRADLINDQPRAFVTTTPKPITLLLEWVARSSGVHVITGSTFDNASNLSAPVLTELRRQYAGTALGEQELFGKLLELAGGGLFKRMDIVTNRVPVLPMDVRLVSTVVGMDPSLTGDEDLTGIVVAGRDANNHMYVLGDSSVQAAGREACLAAWRTVADHNADLLVYEENLGKRYLTETLTDTYNEMIKSGVFPDRTTPPMRGVHAKHGKKTRAEPVALRCEQGRLHMVGEYVDLENEMVLFDPASTRESPDRMDAMVHACLHLMAGEKRRLSVSGGRAYEYRFTQDLYNLDRLIG